MIVAKLLLGFAVLNFLFLLTELALNVFGVALSREAPVAHMTLAEGVGFVIFVVMTVAFAAWVAYLARK